MEMNRKEIKKQYKMSPKPTGVFQIKNNITGKVFLAASSNINGTMNRFKSELSFGSHPNKKLAADWNKYGEENFAFEILEIIKPEEDPGYDYSEELKLLKEMWDEKLQKSGIEKY